MAAANSGYLIGIGVRPKHVSRALLGQPE